tara:strand:- start:2735 stop:3304 length:570 start_codon:yes stop_codon:yes gene_type:complete
MKRKKLAIFSIIFFLIIIISIFYFKSEKKEVLKNEVEQKEEEIYSSNIIKNVKYFSKDTKGNAYSINASIGEIDYSNSNIVYLTEVRAFIKLKNSNEIKIKSDFGKYNINNFDTIFSKNVIVDYLENKITSEYMDFSLVRNSMVISKEVIYKNLKNVLEADVVEINIETKDTKIYRYNTSDKVNIKSKD